MAVLSLGGFVTMGLYWAQLRPCLFFQEKLDLKIEEF
jgi:hypothetical protein